MLTELKRFNEQITTDPEDLLVLAATAKLLKAEFTNRSFPTPAWLDDVTRRIERAIEVQTADRRELRLKQIEAEEEALRTREERRARLQAEKDALLAGTTK